MSIVTISFFNKGFKADCTELAEERLYFLTKLEEVIPLTICSLVIACNRSITNKEKAVMIVFHDEEDGAWQFLDGGKIHKEDAIIISLKEMIEIDPSIQQLAEMGTGYFAVRESADSEWEIYENE